MSRLSALRTRNVSDLICLPKSTENKEIKQWSKGQARSQIPVYTAFNAAVGWRPTTLRVRRGWANFKVSKNLRLKVETLLLYNLTHAKEASYETRAITEQSSKQAKSAQKQAEQVKQANDFKEAKELKHLKQGVIRCLRYIVCLPTPNTYQRSPLVNNDTCQQSNIPIFKHFDPAISPHPNIWTTSDPGPTFSSLSNQSQPSRTRRLSNSTFK